jgi:hypothetical protein
LSACCRCACELFHFDARVFWLGVSLPPWCSYKKPKDKI